MVAFGIVLFLLALWLAPSRGHSWYPQECCSSRDCYPVVDPREIGESGADYIYRGLRIPKAHSRPSPDGLYHVCVISTGFGQRMIRCLFRPTPGS
jgi:hypothetical protein